jgi:hypothetical protein
MGIIAGDVTLKAVGLTEEEIINLKEGQTLMYTVKNNASSLVAKVTVLGSIGEESCQVKFEEVLKHEGEHLNYHQGDKLLVLYTDLTLIV